MLFGMPKEIDGTIVAAGIAAAISLLGLIISKENKVSEFRQAWIDSLMEEIATVITRAIAVNGTHRAASQGRVIDLWQTARQDFVPLNEAWAKIRLRLNPEEQAHADVLRALEEHEALFQAGTSQPSSAELDAADRKLLGTTRILLKHEGEKVKRGETAYKGAKALAWVLLIAFLFLLVMALIPALSGSQTTGKLAPGSFHNRYTRPGF